MAKGNNQKKESKGKPKKDAKAKAAGAPSAPALKRSTEPIGKKK